MRRTICTGPRPRGRPKKLSWLRDRTKGTWRFALAITAVFGLMAVVLTSPSHTQAQSILGTAETFGVLGGAAVTNTGPSTINGDVGVSPGSSITGFPPGIAGPPGTIHQTDAVAQRRHRDATNTNV